jgi:hypothetical protein
MASTLYTSGTVVASTWLNDVDTATYNRLTAVAGTNSITATGPLSMPSITAGDRFFFSPAVTNTAAVTINISGLGAQPITKYGSTNLVAGDLVAGTMALIVYDGSFFQLINPQTFNLTNVVPITNGGTGATTATQALINLGAIGRLIGIQTFTASGTYTPTTGTTRIFVRGVGSGGAGGGCQVVGAGQVSIGGGGGAGAYGEAYITAGFSGTAVTIGAAGVGVANANGGAGSACSFGAFLTLGGGTGGLLGLVGAVSAASGGAGGAAGGSALVNASNGESGFGAISSNAAGWINSGKGGSSMFGSGGMNAVSGGPTAGGAAATGRGAGGGGAGGIGGGAAAAGGGGTAGVITVFEYS